MARYRGQNWDFLNEWGGEVPFFLIHPQTNNE